MSVGVLYEFIIGKHFTLYYACVSKVVGAGDTNNDGAYHEQEVVRSESYLIWICLSMKHKKGMINHPFLCF